MRRDLVQEVLDASQDELFEDVTYTHGPAAPVVIEKAIFGVEIATVDDALFGAQTRQGTHTARAIKAKFPTLTRGDTINDGDADYKVLDFRPVGDGRLEIEISLELA